MIKFACYAFHQRNAKDFNVNILEPVVAKVVQENAVEIEEFLHDRDLQSNVESEGGHDDCDYVPIEEAKLWQCTGLQGDAKARRPKIGSRVNKEPRDLRGTLENRVQAKNSRKSVVM